MRTQIDLNRVAIKGNPEYLEIAVKEAIENGATEYDSTGGYIVFYKFEDELEYYKRLEKGYTAALKGIKTKLKEFKNG